MFPKPKRLKDKNAINYVKGLPCCACGVWYGIDAHHILSRGSGGPDTIANLLPLCRKHHTEIHQYGITKMTELYSALRNYIRSLK